MSSVLPPVPGVPVFNSDGYMDREWEVYFQQLDDSLVSFNASLALKLSLATGLSVDNFVKPSAAGELEDALKAIPGGDVVGTTDVQTMSNKTLEDPTINDGTLNDSQIDNPGFLFDKATYSFVATDEEWNIYDAVTTYKSFVLEATGSPGNGKVVIKAPAESGRSFLILNSMTVSNGAASPATPYIQVRADGQAASFDCNIGNIPTAEGPPTTPIPVMNEAWAMVRYNASLATPRYEILCGVYST